MLLRVASHLFADAIVEGPFRREWDELRDVLGKVEPPLRPAGPFTATGRPPTPKRQRRRIGGRDAYCLFPIDQPALNASIQQKLRLLGWEAEPVAAGALIPDDVHLSLAGDFSKNGLFVEVEFGNQASLFRDLFKFQIAARSRAGRVGVLVLATGRVAKFFDQGVATFEQAVSLIPYMDLGLQMPVVIVGLDLNDWSALRARYDEMKVEADAHGVPCHSYESVFGAEQPLLTLDRG